MTLKEASEKWKTNEKTICKWLCEGKIKGISIVDDKIILPDILKPHIPNKRYNSTGKEIYWEIIKACNKNLYIDGRILGITDERFEMYMDNLYKNDIINKKVVDSNADCILTYKGVELLNKGKRAFIMNFNPNISVSIGLANIGL